MSQKINFYIAFAVGYWVGQYQHGIKPLIIAILLGIVEWYVFSIAVTIVKSWKIQIPKYETKK